MENTPEDNIQTEENVQTIELPKQKKITVTKTNRPFKKYQK